MACCGRRIKAAAKAVPRITHDASVQPLPAPDTTVSIEQSDEPDEVVQEQKRTIIRKRMGAIKTR